MKKSSIALIVCAAFVICGAGLGVAGWLAGGQTSVYWQDGKLMTSGGRNQNHSGRRQTASQELSEFDRISISTTDEDIILVPSDHFAVEYDLDEDAKIFECGVVDGEFRFDLSPKFGIALFNFSLNFQDENDYVKLYYPAGAAFQKVSLEAISGNIDAADFGGGELTLNTTSGSIYLRKAKGEAVAVSNVSGGIILSGITAGSLNGGTTSGSLQMESITADTIELSSISGSIRLAGCSAKTADIGSTSGKITAELMTEEKLTASSISGAIQLEGGLGKYTGLDSTSGSIQVDTPQPETEFRYSLDSLSGDIRVNGDERSSRSDSAAPNEIQVSTISGGIQLQFGQ